MILKPGFEQEREILMRAIEMADARNPAGFSGLKLHSLAIGLPGDPPGRVRFSYREPASEEWDEPLRPGWRLASEVRRFCGMGQV
jgi:hypothetical protein